jgi:hypothetical protein
MDQDLVGADAEFSAAAFGSAQQFRGEYTPEAVQFDGWIVHKGGMSAVIARLTMANVAAEEMGERSIELRGLGRASASPRRIRLIVPAMVPQGHATSPLHNATRVSQRMVYKTVHPETARLCNHRYLFSSTQECFTSSAQAACRPG